MRYRVLYDLNTGADPAKPCGVVVERRDCVEVIAPAEMAFAGRVTEPYSRMGRDLQLESIEPGDPTYFDEVAVDLSRSFAMGEEFEYAEHGRIWVGKEPEDERTRDADS